MNLFEKLNAYKFYLENETYNLQKPDRLPMGLKVNSR